VEKTVTYPNEDSDEEEAHRNPTPDADSSDDGRYSESTDGLRDDYEAAQSLRATFAQVRMNDDALTTGSCAYHEEAEFEVEVLLPSLIKYDWVPTREEMAEKLRREYNETANEDDKIVYFHELVESVHENEQEEFGRTLQWVPSREEECEKDRWMKLIGELEWAPSRTSETDNLSRRTPALIGAATSLNGHLITATVLQAPVMQRLSLAISATLPHVFLSVGVGEHQIQIKMVFDSGAGANLGKLAFHKAMTENFPEVVKEFKTVQEYGPIDLMIGGVDESSGIKVSHIIVYRIAFNSREKQSRWRWV
jgi:hypothetical protein